MSYSLLELSHRLHVQLPAVVGFAVLKTCALRPLIWIARRATPVPLRAHAMCARDVIARARDVALFAACTQLVFAAFGSEHAVVDVCAVYPEPVVQGVASAIGLLSLLSSQSALSITLGIVTLCAVRDLSLMSAALAISTAANTSAASLRRVASLAVHTACLAASGLHVLVCASSATARAPILYATTMLAASGACLLWLPPALFFASVERWRRR